MAAKMAKVAKITVEVTFVPLEPGEDGIAGLMLGAVVSALLAVDVSLLGVCSSVVSTGHRLLSLQARFFCRISSTGSKVPFPMILI